MNLKIVSQVLRGAAMFLAVFGLRVGDAGALAEIPRPSRQPAAREATARALDTVVWTEQARLTAFDGSPNDQFGFSVALDGDTALVGAAFRTTAAGFRAGEAYVFVRSGAAWSLQQTLIAPVGAVNEQFGFAVGLSGDTALVGAPGRDTFTGRVYVFLRTGTTWTLQQTLTAADGAPLDAFGISVALKGDAAMVGASGPAIGAGSRPGAVYAVLRSGTTWSVGQKLTPPDGIGGDRFGLSVDFSADTALIGAPLHSTSAGFRAGQAYIFNQSGGVWVFQQSLTAFDGGQFEGFGAAVSLSGDTALIGKPGSFSDGAYVFVRDGSGWSLQQKLTADDGVPGDTFGTSVALRGDTALIGAPFHDPVPGFAGFDAGQAYVFERIGTGWNLQLKLTASDSSPHSQFGTAAALSGNGALVSAPLHTNPSGIGIGGQAYVFLRSGDVNDFSVAISPPSGTVNAGSSTTFTVRTAVLGGDVGTIDLSVSGLPAGVTGSFVPPSVAGGASSTLTLTASIDAAAATQTFTVTGAAVSVTHTAAASITLVPAPDDFALSVSPASQSVANGGSITYTVSVLPVSGAAQAISLSVSDLPPGVSGTLSPVFVDAGMSSTLTLTASVDAAAVTQAFTVTGTFTSTSHSAGASVTVLPTLTALGTARLWIGLANSDANGLKLDLLAEVYVNDAKVGQGQVGNISTGSSGFNNALQDAIELGLTGGFVVVHSGDTLALQVLARRSCGGAGHASGTARLWYDGQPLDTGASRDAGTRFGLMISGVASTYFPRGGFVLDTSAGRSRTFLDRAVDSSVPCPNRPFSAFGTWSTALP